MKNKLNAESLTLGERFTITAIDFTAIYFFFNIFRFAISYFYFLPWLPCFFVTWFLYYFISYACWRQTLGSSFFDVSLTGINNSKITWWKIAFRQLFASLPGILLLLIYWVYYSPFLISEQPNIWFSIIIIGRCVCLLTLLIIATLRVKIFKMRLAKNGTNSTPEMKRNRKRYIILTYFALLLLAGVSRFVHTNVTNNLDKINATSLDEYSEKYLNHSGFKSISWSWFIVPRPTDVSVKKYIDFLATDRKNINDYIFDLYNQYDHIILCERFHPEMKQYDMIYNLVTDSRFLDNVGVVFTEIGNIDSRNAYQEFTNSTFPNDTILQRELSSFMMKNQTVHPIWPHINWFEFLEKMYHFNNGRENKVDILFSDYDWANKNLNSHRDSIMAKNITTTIEGNKYKKSLTIMNYRHAYLKGRQNCGYYIAEAYPGKVANILINTIDMTMQPLQQGKWDVAFEHMPDDSYAFNLKNSPFGKDRFDHFFPFSSLSKQQYEDMFVGMIFYKPVYQFTFGDGFPYMLQPENEEKIKLRHAKLGVTYESSIYRYLGNGAVRNAKNLYIPNLFSNLFFVWNLFFGFCLSIYLITKFLRRKTIKH